MRPIFIFIHIFFHSFSFIQLFIHFHSFIHSFILSFIHSFIHLHSFSLIYSFIYCHSFILSFFHFYSFFHSFIFIHSFFHSFIQSFIFINKRQFSGIKYAHWVPPTTGYPSQEHSSQEQILSADQQLKPMLSLLNGPAVCVKVGILAVFWSF